MKRPSWKLEHKNDWGGWQAWRLITPPCHGPYCYTRASAIVAGLKQYLPYLPREFCVFLFGWCIGRYWANKNDRLMAVFIAYVMNDWEIPESMHARKKELWAKCKWWGKL